MNKLIIKETTEEDLENILSLWNNGDVMKFVGFPNGLGVTLKHLKEKWFPNINKNNIRKHYSIYHEEIGYCGESFYSVQDNLKCALDIKLFAKARGKGIAYKALKHAINKAFTLGKAKVVYVDPNKKNEKAIALYKKLGFIEYKHPDKENRINHYYFELNYNDWYV